MRRKRSALSSRQRNKKASALSRHFTSHPVFIRSQYIGFYYSRYKEMDLAPLIKKAWRMQKKCYLPVLRPHHKQLWFAPYYPHSRLFSNRFDIPEPHLRKTRIRPPRALQLVLAPLLAFDLQGHRLGMGGGYYDRSFAYLNRRHCRHPLFVGVAYDFQCVPELPAADWDVSLHAVVTESGWRWFRSI